MRLKELFNTMYKLPRSGIYSLVNEKDKRVYISHSKDICTSISRLLRDIHSKNIVYKQMIKDAPKLQFNKLENINNYDTLVDIHTKLDYFIQGYKQRGYSLYNTKHKYLQLKVSIEVGEDLDVVYVKLISSLHKKIVVGVFEKMYEAEEFATLFETMDVVKPVYAINELTRKYIKNNFKSNDTV